MSRAAERCAQTPGPVATDLSTFTFTYSFCGAARFFVKLPAFHRVSVGADWQESALDLRFRFLHAAGPNSRRVNACPRFLYLQPTRNSFRNPDRTELSTLFLRIDRPINVAAAGGVVCRRHRCILRASRLSAKFEVDAMKPDNVLVSCLRPLAECAEAIMGCYD